MMNLHSQALNPFRQLSMRQLFVRGLLLGVLTVSLTPALPGLTEHAYAAPLEDCDLDGFDDSTGAPVPWPGYDETRGDTPAGKGTADWWIKQNEQAAANRDSGSSGGGGSSSGSGTGTSGGSSSGSESGSSGGSVSGSGSTGSREGGSSGGGSGGSTGSASGSGTIARTPAAPAAAVAESPATTADANTAAGAAGSTVASMPASAASSASAESSAAVTALGTSSGGGDAAQSSSLWKALTVGFRGENDELYAGLSLLGTLALAGGLALGVSVLRDAGRRARVQGSDSQHIDEPATVVV